MIQATLYGPVAHAQAYNPWCPQQVDQSKCTDLEQLPTALMATGISLAIRGEWIVQYPFMLLNYQDYNQSAEAQPELRLVSEGAQEVVLRSVHDCNQAPVVRRQDLMFRIGFIKHVGGEFLNSHNFKKVYKS